MELEAVLIHTLKQGSKSVEGRSRQSSARSSGEHDRLELVEPVNRDAERAELVKLVRLSFSLLMSLIKAVSIGDIDPVEA